MWQRSGGLSAEARHRSSGDLYFRFGSRLCKNDIDFFKFWLDFPRQGLQVKLREIPAKTFAALTYSGTNNETTVQEKTNELANWIKSQNLEPIGNAQLARYNPPWTLPFLRRNEK